MFRKPLNSSQKTVKKTGGDVGSWIKNWLRVHKQSLGVNEQFQCDKSRGMRSFTINDPEKIMCSKVPKICWYPGAIQICQDEVTPEWHHVKQSGVRWWESGYWEACSRVYWKEWFVLGHGWLLNYCGYSGQQHCGPVTEMLFLNTQRCHRRSKSYSAAWGVV